MKKTLSINIAGIVFHIEEDAYATLDTYLKSIHAYFKNFEGAKDIVDDIEARIAEKFWNIRETEKTEAITQVHVDALIASLGTIADFQEIEEEDVKKELLNDLKQRWQNETKGSCVFISALEKQNIDLLRQTILNAVREMYQIRYPYRAEFFY